MPYVFFLSYARADAADGYLNLFFQDLCESVRGLTGRSPREVGFKDTSDIQVGVQWPEALENALCTSSCMVCLFSPTYFNRPTCGKEMALFQERLREEGALRGGLAPLFLPILWIRLDYLAHSLPPWIEHLQRWQIDLGANYAEKGLRYLLRVGRNQEYRAAVEHLAFDLVQRVRDYPLECRTPLLRLDDFQSAFEEGNSSMAPPSVLAVTADDRRTKLDRGFGSLARAEDFLSEVETVCRIHEPMAQITRVPGTGALGDHLRIFFPEADFNSVYPLGALDRGVDRKALQIFLDEIDSSYRCNKSEASILISTLVYKGEAAEPDLVREARECQVRLINFNDYQRLVDLRGYVSRQGAKLEADPVYPPALYVSQRMVHVGESARPEVEDALGQIQDWLNEPGGRFVLVLGEFGTGKTFLMHELALRLGKDVSGAVPILLQMRALEKGRSLNELLGQHFASEDISLSKFLYMLKQGKVVLLFDGFDELALRVTYPKAAEHLSTILQAAVGNAKVVMSSRREHFLSEQQISRIVDASGGRIALLRPFDRERIKSFLIRFCEDDKSQADDRLRLIESVANLEGLASNPRMLSFIAGLPWERLQSELRMEREITAARLYHLILTNWLEREVDRVDLLGARPGLSIDDRWKAVTSLACRLWQKVEPSISLNELEEDTAKTLGSLLSMRLEPDVAAFQVASGTLLVRDEGGRFSFLHQSILEWLVARDAATRIEEGTVPDVLSFRPMSPLVADFLIGLAGPERIDAWLRGKGEFSAAGGVRNALLLYQRLARRSSDEKGTRRVIEIRDQYLANEDLSGQDLNGIDFSGSNFNGAQLAEATLIASTLRSAQFKKSGLARVDLSFADLSGADLEGADLTTAKLFGVDLRGARLAGASLRRAKLLSSRWTTLDLADLFGAAVDDIKNLSGFVALPNLPVTGDLVWSSDGNLVATPEGSCLRLWDAVSGQELCQIGARAGEIRALTFSGDSLWLAAGYADGTVCRWHIGSRREVSSVRFRDGLRKLCFSPDSKLLVGVDDRGDAFLWNVADEKEIRPFSLADGRILALKFLQGGVVHAATDRGLLLSWQSPEGPLVSRVEGEWLGTIVDGLCFSPDGRTLAGGTWSGRILLFDTSNGRQESYFSSHPERISAMEFEPSGRHLVTGSPDGTVLLWELPRGREQRKFESLGDRGVAEFKFSPDGRFLATRYDQSGIRISDAVSGKTLRVLKSLGRSVFDVSFAPDHMIAAATSDRTVLLDPASGQEVRRFDRLIGYVAVPDQKEGRVLVGGGDGVLLVCQGHSGEILQRLEGATRSIHSAVFSSDGLRVAGLEFEGSIKVWNLADGRIQHTLGNHIACFAFSSDGTQVLGCATNGTVYRWVLGKDPEELRIDQGKALSLAFSPTTPEWVAFGLDEGAVGLWTLESKNEIRFGQQHGGPIWTVQFDPSGTMLASGSADGTVRLWEAASGQEIFLLKGHGAAVSKVSFSWDGNFLASASLDGTIRLWKVATGACLAIYAPLSEGWVAFAPDGRYKFGGVPGGAFWHVINLCRFEPGELDDLIPGLRLADNASFLDLPPWKAELRRDMAGRPGAIGGDAGLTGGY